MNKLHRPAPLRENAKIKDWFPGDGLYAEMYDEAKSQNMTFAMFLEDMKSEKTGEPTPYYGLTDREIYTKKAAYEKRGEAVPMTVVEELLYRAGIKASGARSDTVGKLFEFADLEVLVPEVLSSKIYYGLLKESLVPEFCATETVVTQGYDYKKLYISDSEKERQTEILSPGKDIGETSISIAEQSIRMRKFGTYLTITYETLQWQRLNVFDVCLQRIGQQIQVDETDDMFYTLVNGDGNSGTTPGTTVQTDSTGTIATADVIEFALGAPTPYKLDKFAGKKALIAEYLTTLAGLYQTISNNEDVGISLPKWYEWDRSIMTTDYFVGVDSRYAIEHLTSGGVMTESEKIIRKQIHGTAITYYGGFGIIDNDAVVIFDETH